MKEFDGFIGQIFSVVDSELKKKAESAGYSICVIPDGVANIDVDDNRLNVWVDLISDRIMKFTVG